MASPLTRASHLSRIREILLTPEIGFLILGTIFGLAMLVLTPPFQVPDEFNHFYRAYQVSEGRWVGVKLGDRSGGVVPKGLWDLGNAFYSVRRNPDAKVTLEDFRAQFKNSFNPLERIYQGFPNTVLYSPVSYAPQAVGIWLARRFGSSPIGLFYSARFFNLLTWLFLTFFAIRKTPIFKWVFTVLALMPMTMSLAPSLSADSLTIASCLLLIAYLLYLAVGPVDIVSRKDLLVLLLVSVVVGQCKQIYISLLGLYILIPVKKFPSLQRYILAGLLVFVPTLAAWSWWTWATSAVYVPTFPDVYKPSFQMEWLLHNPVGYLKIFWNSIRVNANFYVQSFIGILGWLDLRLPKIVYQTFPAFLIGVALVDKDLRYGFPRLKKLLPILIFLVTFFVLALLSFVLWTRPGQQDFIITQGRRLIPLAPLILLPLYNHRVRANERVKLFIPLYLLIVLVLTVCTVFERYIAL